MATLKEIKTPHVEDLSEMTPNANENVKREVVDSTNNHTSFVVKKFCFNEIWYIFAPLIN